MEQTKRKTFLKKPGWLHRPTRSDLLLMIASLFIAAFLWAYIASGSGYSVRFNDIPVIVETAGTKAEVFKLTALSPATGELTVNAELSGSRTDIGGLSKGDLEAYIDFDSGVTDTSGYQIQTLPIRLRRKNGTVLRSAELSVSTADVQMDKIISVKLPVKEVITNLSGSDETIIDTDNITATPNTVSVTGPSTTLQKLDNIRVRLNEQEKLYKEKTFTGCSDFDLIGTDGNSVSKEGLKVQAQFDVTVPVYYIKKLPVTLTLDKNYPAGFDTDWLLNKVRIHTDRAYKLAELTEDNDEKLFIKIKTSLPENKAVLDTYDALEIGSLSLYDMKLGSKWRKSIDINMLEGNENLSNIDSVSVSFDNTDLTTGSFNIPNNTITVLNAPSGCTIENGYTKVSIIGDAAEVADIMASVSDIRATADMMTATIPQGGGLFNQMIQVTLPDNVRHDHVWISPAPMAQFTATASGTPSARTSP
ncbi:MAG: hypothetical protein J6Z45_05125 [Oscillospiraceae bacterium]|nr:hypothetical protein [Oscillospiraceae bacterium]